MVLIFLRKILLGIVSNRKTRHCNALHTVEPSNILATDEPIKFLDLDTF